MWSPPPRPLCPTITHTHTAGLVVWAMVVLGGARVPCVCLPRHHHTRLPSHHHHQRSCATTALTHTHGTWCMHHCHTHTHATCTTTHTKACCVLTTPCHTHHHPLHPPIHTHTTWHTHTASATLPQWCLPSLTTPSTHTHTTDATHTPHRRQTKAKHTTGCGFS